MILIVVKQRVRSKYADDWPSLVEEFTTSTRAEPGNISFDWSRSAEDPKVWVLVEVFRDAEAGKAHVESAHFKAATEQMPNWLGGVPEIIHVEAPGDGWDLVSEGT
ncbi:MAG: putative quinol monooxygenase [Acidimicrobiales bacterium]